MRDGREIVPGTADVKINSQVGVGTLGPLKYAGWGKYAVSYLNDDYVLSLCATRQSLVWQPSRQDRLALKNRNRLCRSVEQVTSLSQVLLRSMM
jgi:hypothetical protein